MNLHRTSCSQDAGHVPVVELNDLKSIRTPVHQNSWSFSLYNLTHQDCRGCRLARSWCHHGLLFFLRRFQSCKKASKPNLQWQVTHLPQQPFRMFGIQGNNSSVRVSVWKPTMRWVQQPLGLFPWEPGSGGNAAGQSTSSVYYNPQNPSSHLLHSVKNTQTLFSVVLELELF